MRRIIDVEKPFHPPPSSALTVVVRKNWDRQEREQLQYAIQPVEKQEIDSCIHRSPDDNIPRLQSEPSAMHI